MPSTSSTDPGARDRARLTYFEMRGRAEPVRLMLHALGIEFDDHRVVDAEIWSELKPRLPFGSLPLYECGSIRLVESHAIFRHLARLQGWMGKDEQADTLQDATQDALAEAQEDLWRFNWIPDYHEKTGGYAVRSLEPRLTKLEAWLRRGRGAGHFFLGDTPRHADFVAFCYIDELDAFFPEVLASYPALVALHGAIAALPGVADYLASGARPVVFGMGSRGLKVDPRVSLAPGAVFQSPWTGTMSLVQD